MTEDLNFIWVLDDQKCLSSTTISYMENYCSELKQARAVTVALFKEQKNTSSILAEKYTD